MSRELPYAARPGRRRDLDRAGQAELGEDGAVERERVLGLGDEGRQPLLRQRQGVQTLAVGAAPT
jgi:hypothetical protein